MCFNAFLFSSSPPDGNILIFLFLDRTWCGDRPGAGFPSLPLSWAFAVMHPHAFGPTMKSLRYIVEFRRNKIGQMTSLGVDRKL